MCGTSDRKDRVQIKDERIPLAINYPIASCRQADGRIKVWTKISEFGKYLRVILLEVGETVHNALFDRNFIEERHED